MSSMKMPDRTMDCRSMVTEMMMVHMMATAEHKGNYHGKDEHAGK